MANPNAAPDLLSQQIQSAREQLREEITKTIDEISAILALLYQELARHDELGPRDSIYRKQLEDQISDYETALHQVYDANEIFESSK